MVSEQKDLVKILIENRTSEIEKVCKITEDFCKQHEIPGKILYSLELVIDELLTNTISYGYEDKKVHEISVQLSKEGKYISLEFRDDAQPFNPLEAPEPDVSLSLEDRLIGGLGIFLVKRLTNEVHYSYENGMNILVLKKDINEVKDDINKGLEEF